MYELFFLDPRVDLGNTLTVISTYSICPFAFGVVYLLRFLKTRAKRPLWIGLLLVLLPPLLIAFAIQIDCWRMDYIAGPDTVDYFDFIPRTPQ